MTDLPSLPGWWARARAELALLRLSGSSAIQERGLERSIRVLDARWKAAVAEREEARALHFTAQRDVQSLRESRREQEQVVLKALRGRRTRQAHKEAEKVAALGAQLAQEEARMAQCRALWEARAAATAALEQQLDRSKAHLGSLQAARQLADAHATWAAEAGRPAPLTAIELVRRTLAPSAHHAPSAVPGPVACDREPESAQEALARLQARARRAAGRARSTPPDDPRNTQ